MEEFQLTIFTAYVIFVCVLFNGPLPSLSDSYYELKEKGRMWQALFTAALWAVGFPMTQIDNEWFEYGGVCLMLVGTAPMFKQRVVKTFHVAGAWGAIGFCLWGLIEQGIYFPTYVTVGSSVLLRVLKVSNLTWWVELIAFYVIEFGLLKLRET